MFAQSEWYFSASAPGNNQAAEKVILFYGAIARKV
jgi:hypothetical protein